MGKGLGKIQKHLHFRDNQLPCSGQRFWEIAAATIEERLKLYGSKTRCFCPSESKATRINGARPHFLSKKEDILNLRT